MLTRPLRIKNPSSVPAASTGSWTNVTDLPTLFACVNMIKTSTSVSKVNGSLDSGAVSLNIAKKRTTVWLWTNSSSKPSATLIFHAFDGDSGHTRSPKFLVCAGIDPSMSTDSAYDLLRKAIQQFASNQGPKEDTTNIYMWTKQGEPLSPSDDIYRVFDKAVKTDVQDAAAGQGEDYSSTPKSRWCAKHTTWRFKKF